MLLLISLSFWISVPKWSTASSRESFRSISSSRAFKCVAFFVDNSTTFSRKFLFSASKSWILPLSSSFWWCNCSISSRLESKASVIWLLNLFTLSSSALFSSVSLPLSSSIDLYFSSSFSCSSCRVSKLVLSSSTSTLERETPWFPNCPRTFILHWTAASAVSLCILYPFVVFFCNLWTVASRTFLSFLKVTSSDKANPSSFSSSGLHSTLVSKSSSSSSCPRSFSLSFISFNFCL